MTNNKKKKNPLCVPSSFLVFMLGSQNSCDAWKFIPNVCISFLPKFLKSGCV